MAGLLSWGGFLILAGVTAGTLYEANEHAEKGARLLAALGFVVLEVVPIVMAHHKYFATNDKTHAHRKAEIPVGPVLQPWLIHLMH